MLVTCTSAGTKRQTETAERLNGKMKMLKAVILVLLLGLCSFGVYHVGWFSTESLWSTTGGLEDMSKTLPLPVQLYKLQEQLYHLRWSAEDVTERALQEGLKQAKLPGFTGRAVQEIINQALKKLEEIQVPMLDYALKSAGAAVIRSRTSPSLRDAKAKVFLYSLPVMDYMRSPELILEVGAPRSSRTKVVRMKHTRYSELHFSLSLLLEASSPASFSHGAALLLCPPAECFLSQSAPGSPRELLPGQAAPAVCVCPVAAQTVSTPENHPGNCWPFPGSQGHVFIRLSMPVIPRAVTMDHVSGTAFHGESISGAPKDFAVYGFKEEHEEQGTFLGQFTFLAALNPSQTFQLKNELPGVVNYIRLQVLSNWGHPDYTCLYRFRVHGDPPKDGGDTAVSSINKFH
ncbi:SUN domain-containing protein 1-like [Columba livia]|uniref:SUN domain-containing protein 1-like n=1 Tax=Columba livia TaxID=8932 RepID=UPI0031B9B540